MDRDTLYFHFANLGLVLIALLSIQSILSLPIFLLLVPGTITGFVLSWQMRTNRPQHLDTFIGMLSLAVCVIMIGRLYDTEISFENLLRILSGALAWLCLFQSYGLWRGQNYTIIQFISVCLLIASVGLSLEPDSIYTVYLSVFLFIFIFATRLSLVCERKSKGSVIVGDQEEVLGLWQQIKVCAIMFSLVLIVGSFVYPLVPRFENLSLRWIPSTLLGIPEKVPLISLVPEASKKIKDTAYSKKEQVVDAQIKKRETRIGKKKETQLQEEKKEDKEQDKELKEERLERFPAREFDKDIDIFEIHSLTIDSDKDKVPLDSQCSLKAEIKLKDGSIIPAQRLVDWKVEGDAKVKIDKDANLIPKQKGEVRVSASYMGHFSNDIEIEITESLAPKKSNLFYLLRILVLLLVLGIIGLFVWIFMRARHLVELATSNPRFFIKEIYASLCRGFKVYGYPRYDHLAYREFFESVKLFLLDRAGPMQVMTEGLLEARFSKHDITKKHSEVSLKLFHEVKDALLTRKEGKRFWRKIVLVALLLDVLLVPRTA